MIIISFIALIIAFIISDFSNETVYNNSHTSKPLFYKISGTWGNHEGSLLLWLLVLSIFLLIFTITSKNLSNKYRILTLFFQEIIIVGFLLFMLFTLYHFGQSDTERLPLNGLIKQLFILARGLSIAGLILFGSDPFYTSRIVESVTGVSLISIVYNFVTIEDLRLFFALLYPCIYLLGS